MPRSLAAVSAYRRGSLSLNQVHWVRYLYSADRDDPSQVQVQREESKAKFRLDSGRLERSRGFGRTELRRLAEHVVAGKYST